MASPSFSSDVLESSAKLMVDGVKEEVACQTNGKRWCYRTRQLNDLHFDFVVRLLLLRLQLPPSFRFRTTLSK